MTAALDDIMSCRDAAEALVLRRQLRRLTIRAQHGGIPEAVRSGVSGLLVAERDRAALHDAMIKLTSSDGNWEKFGLSASHDVMENFESSVQIAKLEAAYDEAVSLKPQNC